MVVLKYLRQDFGHEGYVLLSFLAGVDMGPFGIGVSWLRPCSI